MCVAALRWLVSSIGGEIKNHRECDLEVCPLPMWRSAKEAAACHDRTIEKKKWTRHWTDELASSLVQLSNQCVNQSNHGSIIVIYLVYFLVSCERNDQGRSVCNAGFEFSSYTSSSCFLADFHVETGECYTRPILQPNSVLSVLFAPIFLYRSFVWSEQVRLSVPIFSGPTGGPVPFFVYKIGQVVWPCGATAATD